MSIPIHTPIQFISGFEQFPYLMTALGYISFACLNSIGAMNLVGIMVAMLIHITKSDYLSFFAFMMIVIAQYLMHALIPLNSSYSVLKYVNLYAYIMNRQSPFWVTNVSGWAIQVTSFQVVMMVVGIVAAGLLSLIVYTKQNRYIFKPMKLRLGFKSKSFILQELFQMAMLYKTIAVVVIILCYGGYKYIDYSIVENTWETTLYEIKKDYLGGIDEKKLRELDERILDSQNAAVKRDNCLIDGIECDPQDMENYSAKASNLAALTVIRQDISDVLASGSDYYSDIEGYNQLFGDESVFSMLIHFVMISCAMISMVFLFVIPT